MVTKKKMTVPIFDYRLTILIYDSWDEVSYLFDSGPEPLAITRFQYGAALVAVNSRRGSSIIHEAEHIKNSIWEYKGNEGEHFNESYAKYTVSQMYHTENGRKYVGEKFDMSKAKEVCERYRGIIPQSVTHADVYVAINAQYHDYCELFKAWFGDNIDTKIIESAINFWFKDDDYKGGCKIWKYFKEA